MFKISESQNLEGKITIGGSKNAALPILAANYICGNQIELKNLPTITDIQNMKEMADEAIEKSNGSFDLSDHKVSKIRASILLIPFGLLEYGKVDFVGAGGCKIGKRPLTTFDKAFQDAGVKVIQWENKVFEVVDKPKENIVLNKLSVTSTEAILTYLAFVQDVDYDVNVHQIAIEPHVINTIEFLKAMGANIQLNYDHSVTIKPSSVDVQQDSFEIVGDYIQAGTYFALGAVAKNSEIVIDGFNVKDLYSTLNIAKQIGIDYEILDENSIRVTSKNLENYQSVDFDTRIFPGFPTDLQSIFGAVLTQCNGVSEIFETLFEWRFNYLNELENLGADIKIFNPNKAIVMWPTQLEWNYVSTTDLRGGGAMMIAGTIAKGTTYITKEEIILRGYDNVVEKLNSIGVNIQRVEDNIE